MAKLVSPKYTCEEYGASQHLTTTRTTMPKIERDDLYEETEPAKELSLHDTLVEAGRRWLAPRAKVVATEITATREEPDVIGFEVVPSKICHKAKGTVVIECKASRSDFKNDAKKPFRANPWMGMGKYRYYLAPKGLISPDDLPEKWGLLEQKGSRITVTKIGHAFKERNFESEIQILVSVIRRLGIKEGGGVAIRAFVTETEGRAAVSIQNENTL